MQRMSVHMYVTRHGESQWNVEKKVQGITDTPLTEKGLRQAHELAEKIKTGAYGIDEILYSPLSRAADAARIISETTGIPMTLDTRLIEQNFGKYEGHEWEKSPGEFRQAKMQFACDYSGGESMLKLGQRIYNLIDDVRDRSVREGKTFLLVTHGGVNRMIKSYFVSESNEEFSVSSIENCSLVEYVFGYGFYGAETADIKDSKGLTPRDYYDILSGLWSAQTCAPRLRAEWTPQNKTLGQCSITAFLMQDIFGGKVLGVPLADGNFHCFNDVDGCVFDLTSEQFGGRKLDYSGCPEQKREVHFAKEEKKARYELLRRWTFGDGEK